MAHELVAIIDDEDGVRGILANILADEGYKTLEAASGDQGLALLEKTKASLVLLDVWMPGMDGLAVLAKLRETQHGLPVIMISGHATIDIAVQAVKAGAFDFLEKPLSMEKVLTAINNALEMSRLRAENQALKSQLVVDSEMVGQTPAMNEIRKLIAQAANSTAPVYVSGENGTGKELVARSIHHQSRRSGGPFVAVNCAAIPETLLESELFGHEKGAFTGAVAMKKGRFERADGGTLFLDEVADLSPAAQVKLLRVLQDMQFERVGGERAIQVDVRIIAASNRPIRDAVQSGDFREDLFYRLHVLPIMVPPLRDRRADIPALTQHFLIQETQRLAKPVPVCTREALEMLQAYSWPGNIRQLKNIVQRILALTDTESIEADIVDLALGHDRGSGTTVPAVTGPDIWTMTAGLEFGDAKDAFERAFLLQKLNDYGYNITRTAEAIGMYPSNLHAKIKKYNLER